MLHLITCPHNLGLVHLIGDVLVLTPFIGTALYYGFYRIRIKFRKKDNVKKEYKAN